MKIISFKRIFSFLKGKLFSLKKEKYILTIIVIFFLLLDSISKYVAKTSLGDNTLKVTSTLFFSYNLNAGLSFGILEDQFEWAVIIQTFVTLIAFVGFILSTKLEICLAFMWFLIGGLANIADRFDDSYVIDFISFDDKVYFNFADSYVFIGIIFILYALILTEDKDTNELKKLGFKNRKKKNR